jgi:hypothetical protein
MEAWCNNWWKQLREDSTTYLYWTKSQEDHRIFVSVSNCFTFFSIFILSGQKTEKHLQTQATSLVMGESYPSSKQRESKAPVCNTAGA